MVWYQLSRWFAYLRIEHPGMAAFRWWMPGVVAFVAAAIAIGLPVPPVISGQSGFLIPLSQVIAALPGFFIAALAAVATFQKEGMDSPMPPPAPVVRMRFGASDAPVQLTRRVFLSYLFSYLTVLSLFIALICIAANAVAPSAAVVFDWPSIGLPYADVMRHVMRFFFFMILFSALASLIITTLQGIYFLTERMHQSV